MIELLRETWAYARSSKKWWIVPLVSILALLAVAAVVLQGAPFLYPFF